MQGTENVHSSLRTRVIEHMRNNADDFAPFVEDDQTLDQHLAKMKKV